ncbi:diguanylate cyclase [Anaerovorax odorimutans]|uniref:Stage 0 sporulation protein A homolog n=1 Tax=Anaerovorax odorimutans TaxID=109327 RepID=A0ABT1RQ04_9FIRM|nr:diguanylate cyclase [Anaerovorax odorimutans]MCQ4637280.1 diguanylate cyclase [Anaerovorax odorimutans]
MCRDTILIVDDMEINRTILCSLFKDEYQLLEAENGEQALLLLNQYHSSIAIMLLDVVMPEKNGYQVLEEMNGNGLLSEVPVIVITADDSLEGELRAFDLGASDIIAKPFEPHVVKRRVDNIIELYLHRHNLEDLVDEQAIKLRESNDVLIDALSSVIEYRSLESGQHIKRIRLLTKVLLEEVRESCPEYGLNEHKINAIASASAMHDIGKIAIPDNILNKPGRLTYEEFEIMKTHSLKGCEILASLSRMEDKEYLRYAYNICRHHHERWDGNGYPDGLAGDAIPICAQVTGIADAYDALTSDRVYKKAIAHERAVEMILNGECGVFSPKLLSCFQNVKQQMAVLVKRYADGVAAEDEQLQTSELAGVFREENISAFEKERMKYHAMLRYEDAIVGEVDLATNSWQLVYSSGLNNPELFKSEAMDKLGKEYIETAVHPQDREQVFEIWKQGLADFFAEGRFQQSWQYRIKGQKSGQWQQVIMTLVRVDTEHPQQKKGLVLWKKYEDDKPVKAQNAIDESSVFHSIFHGVRQLRNDKWLTIIEMEDSFLGYSRQQIEERFDNRYMNLIYQEDRDYVLRQLSRQLNSGSEYEIEYRAVNARGEIVWLLSKGQLVQDGQGGQMLYGVPIDISKTKRTEEQLQMSLERYKIILEQTNDIIFEWDIANDHVDFSANWKEKFGYEPITENVSQRIIKASHLHPDDTKDFKEYIEEMRSGKRYNELEFRVSDARGRYRWSKIRATTQFDSKGAPYRVIGLVGDINDEKLATQELQARAERDILTKLYNKDSARQRIEQRLELVDSNNCCALFIIDLDNFKLINDRYGHMFGDAVLKKIAEQLSQLFRNEDVLSRIGGDEFMALFQGMQSREHIEAIAGRIIERFRQTFATLLRTVIFRAA